MSDDRGRLDSLRAWLLSDPHATYLADDVRWAIAEIERHRPELSVPGGGHEEAAIPVAPSETDGGEHR